MPDAVIGHSQGEIAAAYVAGALSLEDAARVVALRSRLLVRLSGAGGMVSLACGLPQAQELVAQWGDRLNIAAVNGVSAVVVSGEVDALEELIAALRGRQRACPQDRRRLRLALGAGRRDPRASRPGAGGHRAPFVVGGLLLDGHR